MTKSSLEKQKGFLLNPFRFKSGDPYFNKVKVLLPLSGANNSVAFPDIKGNIWTPFNGASILTNHWVAGAGNFSGVPMGLSTPYNAAMSFGDQDFCVEFDYFPIEDNHTGAAILGQWGSTNGSIGWLITNSWGDQLPNKICVAASPNGYYGVSLPMRHFYGIGINSDVLLNTWQRIAVTRLNGVFSIYLNGYSLELSPMGGGNTTDGNFTIFDPMLPLSIFPLSSPGNSAQIKNLRITVGESRYSANYTNSTLPFPIS